MIDFNKLLLDHIYSNINECVITGYNNRQISPDKFDNLAEEIQEFLLKIRKESNPETEKRYYKEIMNFVLYTMNSIIYKNKDDNDQGTFLSLSGKDLTFLRLIGEQKKFMDVVFQDISFVLPFMLKTYCDLCFSAPNGFLPFLSKNDITQNSVIFIENPDNKKIEKFSFHQYFRYLSSLIEKSDNNFLQRNSIEANKIYNDFLEKKYERNKHKFYREILKQKDYPCFKDFVINEDSSYFVFLESIINEETEDDFKQKILSFIEIEEKYRESLSKADFYKFLIKKNQTELFTYYLENENQNEQSKIIEELKDNNNVEVKKIIEMITKKNKSPKLDFPAM